MSVVSIMSCAPQTHLAVCTSSPLPLACRCETDWGFTRMPSLTFLVRESIAMATSRIIPHSGQEISCVVSLGSISSEAPQGHDTDVPLLGVVIPSSYVRGPREKSFCLRNCGAHD